MKNEYPTYIILDIPEPYASDIINIRSKYDSYRAKLPAEITVFGSTGTRHILEGQDIDYIVSEINRIKDKFQKVTFSFIGLNSFPGSSGHFFYLEPDNKDAFLKINEVVRNNAQFKFEKSDIPYTAHCTIGNVIESDTSNIRKEIIPEEEINLNKLSLIQFNPQKANVEWLNSWQLT